MNQGINEPLNQWIWVNESMMSMWINPWISEPMIQWFHWISKHKNQWIDQSTNQRISESMKHWSDESMNPESMTQWSSESANPWINEIINESMNRWINGSMNQWMSEAMNRRINEWTNERVERWMNGRIVSEVLLCWATSALSDLFAQPSLLSATSSLSSLLSGTLLRFPATRVFSSHNVRTGLHHTDPGRSGRLSFLHFFFCKNRALTSTFPTSSVKSAPIPSVSEHFQTQMELSLQSCALLVDNFPRSRPAVAETQTLLLRPPATMSEKTHGSSP